MPYTHFDEENIETSGTQNQENKVLDFAGLFSEVELSQ